MTDAPEIDEATEEDTAEEASGQSTDSTHAQAVLEHLVRSVVEDAEAVRVNVDDHGNGKVEFTVEVGQGDMGRVIGRRGRIANAIRTVVRAAASKDDLRVDVEFLD